MNQSFVLFGGNCRVAWPILVEFLFVTPRARLKKRTDFSPILGTFQKCNFCIESKKLFCCIKHIKAHQILKFCTILCTRFNITDLQSCQICFIGKLIFMVLKSKNLQNRTLAHLGMHTKNSLRYKKTLTIWSKFLSYMLLRKMRLDLLIIFYSAGVVGFIK